MTLTTPGQSRKQGGGEEQVNGSNWSLNSKFSSKTPRKHKVASCAHSYAFHYLPQDA